MSEPSLTNRTPYFVLGGLLLLAAGGFLGWRVYQAQRPPPAPVVAEPQPVDAGEPPPPSLNAADGDALLKDAAASLSAAPELLKWLAEPGIVRRLVVAVVQISDGESPHETLGFLLVPGTFSPTEKGKRKAKKYFLSAASTARYDPVAKVIGSIDAAAAGRLYARLRPFAEAVFREIAPPGKKLDDQLSKAIEHLAAVPLSDRPLELKPAAQGIAYEYVDPKLEALSRAQKHLLRMGPTNGKLIVAQLQAFHAASSSR